MHIYFVSAHLGFIFRFYGEYEMDKMIMTIILNQLSLRIYRMISSKLEIFKISLGGRVELIVACQGLIKYIRTMAELNWHSCANFTIPRHSKIPRSSPYPFFLSFAIVGDQNSQIERM